MRAFSVLLVATAVMSTATARADDLPPPSGPPPAITPAHEAEVRAGLEQESRAAQERTIYAQSAADVDRERWAAWVARGNELKPSGFDLPDAVAGGVDVAGAFTAYVGRGGLFSVGSRVMGHVALWRWLQLEARGYLASEVSGRLHFATTAGVLSMRAEVVTNHRGSVYASLGAGAEAPLGGGARTPDASLLLPLSLGASFCAVAIGRGCFGATIEFTLGLRVPFGGDDTLGMPRGYVAFNLGPAVLF